jgi:hypothetical protein
VFDQFGSGDLALGLPLIVFVSVKLKNQGFSSDVRKYDAETPRNLHD